MVYYEIIVSRALFAANEKYTLYIYLYIFKESERDREKERASRFSFFFLEEAACFSGSQKNVYVERRERTLCVTYLFLCHRLHLLEHLTFLLLACREWEEMAA